MGRATQEELLEVGPEARCQPSRSLKGGGGGGEWVGDDPGETATAINQWGFKWSSRTCGNAVRGGKKAKKGGLWRVGLGKHHGSASGKETTRRRVGKQYEAQRSTEGEPREGLVFSLNER